MQAFFKTGKVTGGGVARTSAGAKSTNERIKLPQPWVEK